VTEDITGDSIDESWLSSPEELDLEDLPVGSGVPSSRGPASFRETEALLLVSRKTPDAPVPAAVDLAATAHQDSGAPVSVPAPRERRRGMRAVPAAALALSLFATAFVTVRHFRASGDVSWAGFAGEVSRRLHSVLPPSRVWPPATWIERASAAPRPDTAHRAPSSAPPNATLDGDRLSPHPVPSTAAGLVAADRPSTGGKSSPTGAKLEQGVRKPPPPNQSPILQRAQPAPELKDPYR
jgi:hypothetical protein